MDRTADQELLACLRKALALAWEWIDDPELEGTLIVSSLHGNAGSDRMRNLLAEARHEKDTATLTHLHKAEGPG